MTVNRRKKRISKQTHRLTNDFKAYAHMMIVTPGVEYSEDFISDMWHLHRDKLIDICGAGKRSWIFWKFEHPGVRDYTEPECVALYRIGELREDEIKKLKFWAGGDNDSSYFPRELRELIEKKGRASR